MAVSPLRYKKLIKILPKHKHANSALIEAGFKENTANKQSKSVLASALRYQAKEVLNMNKEDLPKGKQLMSDILGMTSEELFNRLKWLALENDKDAGTALKILAPLVKEHGVILNTEDDKTNVQVPILNVIVGDKTVDKPVIEHVEQTPLPDNGSTKP